MRRAAAGFACFPFPTNGIPSTAALAEPSKREGPTAGGLNHGREDLAGLAEPPWQRHLASAAEHCSRSGAGQTVPVHGVLLTLLPCLIK